MLSSRMIARTAGVVPARAQAATPFMPKRALVVRQSTVRRFLLAALSVLCLLCHIVTAASFASMLACGLHTSKSWAVHSAPKTSCADINFSVVAAEIG